MRTRRSPRNQDRIWRAIGQELAHAAGPVPTAAPGPDPVPIEERWWLSKRTRAMLARDVRRRSREKAG